MIISLAADFKWHSKISYTEEKTASLSKALPSKSDQFHKRVSAAECFQKTRGPKPKAQMYYLNVWGDSGMIREEGWKRGSQQALSRKPECGWAHSLPVKSGDLRGSKPCFLPGNLSIKQSSKFPSASDSPDTLGRHPWWCEEQWYPGLSREAQCPSVFPPLQPQGLFIFPAGLLVSAATPSLEFLFCVSTILWLYLLMLKHFAFF